MSTTMVLMAFTKWTVSAAATKGLKPRLTGSRRNRHVGGHRRNGEKVMSITRVLMAFTMLLVSAAASNEYEPRLDKNGTTGVKNRSRDPQPLEFQEVASRGSSEAERAGNSLSSPQVMANFSFMDATSMLDWTCAMSATTTNCHGLSGIVKLIGTLCHSTFASAPPVRRPCHGKFVEPSACSQA